MLGRPAPNEADSYYSRYIERVAGEDVMTALEKQLDETVAFLSSISEEQSLHRYAPDKWSIRQLLNHVNDTERVFALRALWFARGFPDALPSYDQEISAASARADDFSWASHVDDFRAVRAGTLTLFRNMPEEAWLRIGIASGNPFTVRALAYITAGHVSHHISVLRERYL
ncbi:MAG: DinB family protein [bacterium]